jgi:hypothetical protein
LTLQAANLLSVCWLNALMTGVAFCGEDSNDVAAVAYDQDELAVWTGAAVAPPPPPARATSGGHSVVAAPPPAAAALQVAG